MPSDRNESSARTDSTTSAQPEVSKLLRAHRRRAGLSQTQLAELAHMSPAAVGALEQGSRRAPYRQTIVLLANALGLSSEDRSGLEAAANRARAKGRPPPTATASTRSNLPVRFTSFIERDETLEIASLLVANRCVTITGSAGVGKTRTALEAASLQGDQEVVFVDLSALAQSGFIVGELAAMFDVPLGHGQKQLETIIRELRSRHCLIVIDNCEHVIAEASSVADAILRGCPSITILATSRERLGLSSELVYRLPPLVSPPPKLRSDDGRQYAALELFIARAQAADARFEFKPDDLQIASDICRELEGIPLAIELAAARAPMLGLRTLQSRLRDLAAPHVARDWPVRHQTMLAALGWSYDLLDDAEKTVLRRGSIFAGGFTLAASEQVCSDQSLPVETIAGLIIQLAAKSLIDITYYEGDARYRLLESVRTFGLTKLDEQNEAESTARKHVAWVAAFARDLHLRKVPVPQRLQDLDNVRAAVRFCFASPLEDDIVTAGDIVGMGRHLWLYSDRYFELKQLIDEALTRIDESSHQSTVGILLGAVSALVPATRRSEVQGRAVALLTATGEISGAGALCALRAVSLQRSGQFAAAKEALGESERLLSRCAGAEREKSLLAVQAGWILSEQGDVPGARRRLLQLDRMMKEAKDESLLPTRASLAIEIEAADDNLAGAIEICCEFIEYARTSDRWKTEASSFMDVQAICYMLVGDVGAAVLAARLCQPRWKEHRSMGQADGFIDAVALIGVVRDNSLASARLTGAANALHNIDGTTRTSLARRAYERTQAQLASSFSQPQLAQHYEYGAQMSLDEIVEETGACLV
jgi:predicted ATPase/DNA-binding XRE family transcriptional regulator